MLLASSSAGKNKQGAAKPKSNDNYRDNDKGDNDEETPRVTRARSQSVTPAPSTSAASRGPTRIKSTCPRLRPLAMQLTQPFRNPYQG
jgi:hypothetical protein